MEEGGAEGGTLNEGRRRRAGRGFDPAPPGADVAVAHPLESGAEIVLSHARIEESPVAKVFDDWSRSDQAREDVRRVSHGSLSIRMRAGREGRNCHRQEKKTL